MNDLLLMFCRVVLMTGLIFLQPLPGQAQTDTSQQRANDSPAVLVVDARDVAIGLVSSSLSLPARPGIFHLAFPQWIPAEDGPTGPIAQIAMIRMLANGRAITWSRDDVDMYRFSVEIPPGVTRLDVQFTTIMNNYAGGTYSDGNIGVIDWNRHVFFESGADSAQYPVQATILIPKGWDFATSLPVHSAADGRVIFDTVSLAKLVDSPLVCGRYVQHQLIGNIDGAPVSLDLIADNPSDLAVSQAVATTYRNMVLEGDAMYGSRHFDVYHSIVTLSDRLGVGGLDHHETGEVRLPDDFFTNPGSHEAFADQIPHEFSHSWNGDYRAADGLAGTSFEEPMKTDLMWIREGLNTYLGDVLALRSGMIPKSDFPEYIAAVYAELDSRPGRTREPIIDLATGLPALNASWGLPYMSLTRPSDLYLEGELVWFDVDTIIRFETKGQKSIDDFLKLLAGKPDTGPITVPYSRAEIEALLNQTAPYDWHALFENTIYKITPHPPSDELERAGWALVYTDTPNKAMQVGSVFLQHPIDAWYSIGLWIDSDGRIQEVRKDSVAWDSGMNGSMRITFVDGKAFSAATFDDALHQSAVSNAPLTFTVRSEGSTKTIVLHYRGGARYPHLVQIPGRPDMLEAIVSSGVK